MEFGGFWVREYLFYQSEETADASCLVPNALGGQTLLFLRADSNVVHALCLYGCFSGYWNGRVRQGV